MAEHAGSTEIIWEVPNALGQLWQLAPRFAKLMVKLPNYAKAVQTYLRAIDFYCREHGVRPSKVRVDTWIHDGRLVQRITG